MQLVHEANVQSRFSNGLARAVELICPYCQKLSAFETKPWQEHGRKVAAAEAPCARCERTVQFVQLLDDTGARLDEGLHVYPPTGAREAMPGSEYLHELANPLGRTYDSALRLYNKGEWGPAALVVRHLLEGLASRLLPDDKRELPLSRQLEALPKEVDLTRPLHDIAPLLATGGTFGREFDDEAGIGQGTAAQLLELAEQLITYLVVLPGNMAELKSRIATAPVPLRRSASG